MIDRNERTHRLRMGLIDSFTINGGRIMLVGTCLHESVSRIAIALLIHFNSYNKFMFFICKDTCDPL